MTIISKTIQVAANTSTGTQDITTSKLGGITPVGAIVTVTNVTANGTAAPHRAQCIGATDGTNMICTATAAEDGGSGSDTISHWSDTKVISLAEAIGTKTIEFEADLTGGGFITNGIRINITNAPPGAYLMQWEFFGGTAAVFEVGSEEGLTTGASAISHSLGEVPAFVGFLSNGESDGTDTIGDESRMSIGLWDGTIQRCVAYRDDDGDSAGRISSIFATDFVAAQMSLSVVGDFVVASGLTDTDFDLTPDSDWTGMQVGWFAIGFGGEADITITDYDTPATATTEALTGLSSEPDSVLMLMTRLTSADSVDTTDESNLGVAVSMFDDTDGYMAMASTDDGNGTLITYSMVNNKPVYITDETDSSSPGTLHEADLDSMDSGGFTLDFTTSGSVRKGVAVTFEGNAGGGGGGSFVRPPLIIGI